MYICVFVSVCIRLLIFVLVKLRPKRLYFWVNCIVCFPTYLSAWSITTYLKNNLKAFFIGNITVNAFVLFQCLFMVAITRQQLSSWVCPLYWWDWWLSGFAHLNDSQGQRAVVELGFLTGLSWWVPEMLTVWGTVLSLALSFHWTLFSTILLILPVCIVSPRADHLTMFIVIT